MDDSQRLAGSLSRIAPSWDEARTERAWLALQRRRRKRAALRVVGATAAVALLAVGGYHYTKDDAGPVPAPTVAVTPVIEDDRPRLQPERTRDIVIHEGFTITPEEDATVDVARAADDAVAVEVTRGKSHFRVATRSRAPGKVSLRAGELSIAVYASEFSVARYQDVAEVWSHDGATQVVWRGETIVIGEGEHRRFDPGAVVPDESDTPPAADLDPAPRPRPTPDWRPLAREGDFDAAYRILRVAGYRNRVADLMLAADVFRMSGHPGKAVKPLRTMVAKHQRDPRAPLAAFTLGRILLDDLGRPAAAARAFAKARTFAPRGAMAEDALAREAEAWSKAGHAGKARERAELYLNRYPRGHRARAVRHYGGL